MTERTQLGEMILKHWRQNCPQMVRDLQRENRLAQAVSEAQDLTGDLLYELVSVQRLNYQAAWEIAMREWALMPEENRHRSYAQRKSTRSRKRPHRGTSG